MKLGHTFTPQEAHQLATELLKRGMPAHLVRQRLAAEGVRWQYGYTASRQGLRERLRRLRQEGKGLCSQCKQNSYPLGQAVNVCAECLERKWQSPSATPTR